MKLISSVPFQKFKINHFLETAIDTCWISIILPGRYFAMWVLFLNTTKAVLIIVWKHKSNKIFTNTSTYEDIILWKHLFLCDGRHNAKQSKYTKGHFMRLTFLRPMWAISAFVVLRLWSEKHILRSEYIYGIFFFRKVKSPNISSWSSLLRCYFHGCFVRLETRLQQAEPEGFHLRLPQTKDWTCPFCEAQDSYPRLPLQEFCVWL